jgi:general secretion pathway protein A
MNKTLLALYGLKWNPFAPGVPAEALHVSPRVDSFCRRVRHLVAEGGFAVVPTETKGPGESLAGSIRSTSQDFGIRSSSSAIEHSAC